MTQTQKTESTSKHRLFFSRSHSEAQASGNLHAGFWQKKHEEKTPEQPAGEQAESQDGPVFSKSKHESHGIIWRLQNAVKKENMLSTVMTLGFIKGWADKTLGAWGVSAPGPNIKLPIPEIPGMGAVNKALYGNNFDKSKLTNGAGQKPKTVMEKTMAAGVTAALVQNIAFFMTTRGGELPEGDNVWQKTVNSLKHPDRHAVHFSTVTISGILALLCAGKAGMGLQGLKNMQGQYGSKKDFFGSSDFKTNTSLLAGGIAGLICAPLIFAGLFRIKDKPEDAQKEQENTEAQGDKPLKTFSEEKNEKSASGGGFIASLKPGHMKDMWAYAMKHDRMGLVGRGLALVLELGFIAEGRLALSKDPTNAAAYKTVQGGLVGLVLSVMQSHFVYDKLLNNSRADNTPSR